MIDDMMDRYFDNEFYKYVYCFTTISIVLNSFENLF